MQGHAIDWVIEITHVFQHVTVFVLKYTRWWQSSLVVSFSELKSWLSLLTGKLVV
jgi:hypothetical protein